MEQMKNNIVEIIMLIGILNISVGFFMYSTIAGFIGTGGLLMVLAFLILYKGGDE